MEKKSEHSFIYALTIFIVLCALTVYSKHQANLLPHPDTDGEVVERAMIIPIGIIISAIFSLIIYAGLKLIRFIRRKLNK